MGIAAYIILSSAGITLPFIASAKDIHLYTLFFLSANFLLFLMFLRAIAGKRFDMPHSALYYLPLVFLFYIFIGQIYSINTSTTRFGFMLFGSVVICGLSIPLLGLPKKIWVCWTTTLILAVTAFSIYAIYQYITAGGNYNGRAHSVFVNPNSFSGYLLLIMPLLVGLYFSREKHWKWLLIPIAIQYSALLASGKGGRWPLFVGAISFVIFFYRMIFPKIAGLYEGANTCNQLQAIKQRLKPLLVVLTVATILFAIPMGLHNEASPSKIREAFPPMMERFKIWESTWEVIKENPVFGTGYFTFHNIYLKYKDSAFRDVNHFFTHNDYLQLWSEVGIIGLGIFLAFLFFYFRDGIRALFSDRLTLRDKYIVSGILLGAFIMLVHTSIDFDLYIPEIIFIFWLYVAYIISKTKEAGLCGIKTIEFNSNRFFSLLGQKKLYILATAFFLFSSLWLTTPYLSGKYGEKGGLYLQAKNYEKAVKFYKKAIKIDSVESSHHHNLAEAILLLHPLPDSATLAEVEKEFKKAIELEPYRPELTFSLTNLYLEYYPGQKDKEAIELLKRIIELDPTDPNNSLNLVKVYQRLNMNEEAMKAMMSMKKSYPDYAPGLIMIIDAYRSDKDYEKALREAESLIKNKPEYNYAHFLKAEILQDMRRYDEAYAEYQLALREKGREGDVWYAIGLLSLKQNKPKQAEAAFRKAVEYRSLDRKEKRD
ncbi:MAG: O-antigen ligase family protein [Deltaproteobacteria bacterium]|nr:O-antigen ligase family protein [Deltaproteobacteria bacterium]